MADTSELLRLCDRVIAEGSRVAAYMNYERNTVPDWYKDVAIPSVVLPIARALKSRLQAEAPEDAQHEKIKDALCSQLEIQDFANASLAVMCLLDELKRLRELTTSQAEAQAPTTAASVLTEDDRDFIARQRVNCYEQFSTRAETVKNFLSIIDRLTVGAPAPAPTMPTREQIARTVASGGAFKPEHMSDPFWENDRKWAYKKADAVIALFAKGDTP